MIKLKGDAGIFYNNTVIIQTICNASLIQLSLNMVFFFKYSDILKGELRFKKNI